MPKKCSSCGETKRLSDFHKKKQNRDGLEGRCKPCVLKERQDYYAANPDAYYSRARKSSLKLKFGITEEQYDELLAKQNHCCAMCDRHETEFTKRLAVDHSHKTGEIRGLLCNYCNHRVVGNHTDGNKLRRIADYIEQGTGWFVPNKKKGKEKNG